MATFPSIEPSYSVKKQQKPITKVVRFADGYEHRLMFGILNHQNPRQYNLRWENITEDEADVSAIKVLSALLAVCPLAPDLALSTSKGVVNNTGLSVSLILNPGTVVW